MRIVKTKVYEFSELSEESKEKALEGFRNDGDLYGWHEENQGTLNAFLKHFSFVEVSDWCYGSYGRDYIKFRMDNDIGEMTGYRFWKYLNNNGYFIIKELFKEGRKELDDCCLTGYCLDVDILKPILKLMKYPMTYKNSTAYEIISKCLHNWLKSADDDFRYAYTDEAIIELIDINDYEFTEQGKLV